jgi:hypothetical protein
MICTGGTVSVNVGEGGVSGWSGTSVVTGKQPSNITDIHNKNKTATRLYARCFMRYLLSQGKLPSLSKQTWAFRSGE